MYLIRRTQYYNASKTFRRLYSFGRKDHYEVLKLRKNCSDKDIKEAFIRMSKEFHPDKNKDAKAQEKFVRIVEAYNILGKPGSRARYDNTIEISSRGGSSYNMYRSPASHNVRNNQNYSSYYYQTSQKTTSEENTSTNGSYYGFAGIKKLPNYYIICMCFGVAVLGVIVQLLFIRNMYAAQRARAQERSILLAEELNKVRAAARDNGNELQTRLLLEKIVTASSPTITTASLGQALASEQK